jgi:uncharacterized phosphosugar-binding protein
MLSMEMFSSASFAATLALLGIVIMVSALLSGLIERLLARPWDPPVWEH